MEKIFEVLNSQSRTVKEGTDLASMEFRALKEFVGQDVIRVDGFFFTNSKYGKQVSIVASGYKINMPKWCVEKFESIQENENLIKMMFEGHLGLTGIKEKTTKNGTTITFLFATI